MQDSLARQVGKMERNQLLLAVAWLLVFAAAVLSYLPGLHGPFVLDDFGAIAALGNSGGVDSWESFKAFVFGGNAGPTGRPVALLTFLIDANDWPTESFPFKRTNLVIHLTNGVLLGVLTQQVLRLVDIEVDRARWIALLSTAFWLLHPFLVSTTLYAVQRMAQLATLFALCGLIGFLHGRSMLAINATKAYWTMGVSISVFTVLATLSKENGILLPVMAGVLEITVIASRKERFGRLNGYWMLVFLAAPTIVIFAYLARTVFSGSFFDIVPPRDFSLYERLLTQPRILTDYLQHWFIPKLYTTGVFQDHFLKSTGALSPISTLLTIGLHVVVLVAAILKRRQWPLVALAALFFYASHLLESTVLNLELYFEHRNYLATVFLILPAAVLLSERVSRRTAFFSSLCVVLLLAGFTRYSATVWSDYRSMVEASAMKAPTSIRAQARHAANLFNAQRHAESIEVLDAAIARIPGDHPLLLVNRLTILCDLGQLDSKRYDQVAETLSATHYDPRMIKIYEAFLGRIVDKRCPELSLGTVKRTFDAMLISENDTDSQSLEYSQLQYLIGFTQAFEGQGSAALASFERSLAARPGAGHAMQMAALMATNEYYSEALRLSDFALAQLSNSESSIWQDGRVSAADVRAFQDVIRADMLGPTPGGDTVDPVR